MNEPVDPTRCPLCRGPNTCGMAAGGSTCWCFELSVPAELLATVPAEAQGVACICRACIERSKPGREP